MKKIVWGGNAGQFALMSRAGRKYTIDRAALAGVPAAYVVVPLAESLGVLSDA